MRQQEERFGALLSRFWKHAQSRKSASTLVWANASQGGNRSGYLGNSISKTFHSNSQQVDVGKYQMPKNRGGHGYWWVPCAHLTNLLPVTPTLSDRSISHLGLLLLQTILGASKNGMITLQILGSQMIRSYSFGIFVDRILCDSPN